LVRNVKEISLASDRTRCAGIFTPIARSRASALEAIAIDCNFLRRDALLVLQRTNTVEIFSRSKNIFDRVEILQESR